MNNKNLAFGSLNYILLGVGIAIIIIGFILMSGEGTTEEMFNDHHRCHSGKKKKKKRNNRIIFPTPC